MLSHVQFYAIFQDTFDISTPLLMLKIPQLRRAEVP